MMNPLIPEQLDQSLVDVSRCFGMSIDEVREAIAAGLCGEYEPLREFHLLLTDDAVRLEAVRLGLIEPGGIPSESEKMDARASLISGGLSVYSGS